MQNFTELYEVERRYEELAHRMSTPDAAANADEYARMMRDYKELTPLIEEYRRYTDLQQQEADAKEMLAAESDPAFAAMVQQELCEIGRNLAQSEENLRLLLIPKDADDEKSVILEIRAGAGGEAGGLRCARSRGRGYSWPSSQPTRHPMTRSRAWPDGRRKRASRACRSRPGIPA